MNRRVTIYLIMLCLLTTFGHPRASAAPGKIVFVSIAPQKYFVDAIGGDFVKTTVIVPPNHSPADYEPSPSQMIQMSKADSYFAIGVAFETKWLKNFSDINPGMKIVHTDAGIEKKPINRHKKQDQLGTQAQAATHQNHDPHPHHGTPDPHIWLSPPLVKIQAEHILNGLVSIDPVNRENYKNNYLKFLDQIDRLDNELTTLFSTETRENKFLVFHPSWGYFADAYGLTQISIEIEGKSPKARDVKNLIEFARQHHIQLIFVQPQFSVKHAEIIANEINGQLIYTDPLAENWYDNIRAVAVSIKQALK